MIGIGITTRNRPQVLHQALEHFRQYLPINSKIVVVDDASEMPEVQNVCEQFPFTYLFNVERKGIAYSKNKCLKQLRDCEYIFLFDDDCFPVQEGWASLIIDAHQRTQIHHFNFLHPPTHHLKAEYNTSDGVTIQEFGLLGGVMLFITQEVLKQVGGFNPNYKIYGHEHTGYTYRIARAGLLRGIGPFLQVKGTEQYLRALDYDNFTSGDTLERHSLNATFKSSLMGENVAAYIQQNGSVLQEDVGGPIYITLGQ